MFDETRKKEKVSKRIFVGTMQNYTQVVSKKRWNYDDAKLGYDAFIESFKGLLLHYGYIQIPGVGTFEIQLRPEHVQLNNFKSAEQKEYLVPDRQFAKFTPSKVLKEEVKKLPYKFVGDIRGREDKEDGEE